MSRVSFRFPVKFGGLGGRGGGHGAAEHHPVAVTCGHSAATPAHVCAWCSVILDEVVARILSIVRLRTELGASIRSPNLARHVDQETMDILHVDGRTCKQLWT